MNSSVVFCKYVLVRVYDAAMDDSVVEYYFEELPGNRGGGCGVQGRLRLLSFLEKDKDE